MPSSELALYERFGPGRDDGDWPAHAGELRRLIGDIDHLADQYAQRRVEWWPISGKYFEPEVAIADTTTWTRCWTSGPFDLHVYAPSGAVGAASAILRSYALRTRLHGAISTGTGTARFRVAVALQGAGAQYTQAAFVTASNVAEFSTASTTHGWLDAERSVTFLDSDAVAQARSAVIVQNAIGGPPDAALWLRCTAEVWASTSVVGNTPRVSGLVVEEFFAP